MTVPVERSSFASTSADEAWDALSQMYTRARPHTSSPDAALSTDSAVTPDIAVDQVQLSAAQGAFSESPDQVNVISVLSGRFPKEAGEFVGTSRAVPDREQLHRSSMGLPPGHLAIVVGSGFRPGARPGTTRG